MPDLDPAHVEAVAEAVASPDHLRDYWRDVARAILTSTDPDVRLAQFLGLVEELDPAALLAALVRAGVLREERANQSRRVVEPCDAGPFCPYQDHPPGEAHVRYYNDQPSRRYVTEWSKRAE